MKKNLSFSLFLLLAWVSIAHAAPLKIVASFSILGDMVARVCGEHGKVKTLVGPDSDAHVYEPKPADAKTILDADLVFVNGLRFEGWIERLISASETKAPVIAVTKGVATLPSSHTDETPDPHAWSSPVRAKTYIENIRDALCAFDPTHKDVYQRNAAVILQEIEDLINWTRREIEKVPPEKRKVITVHDGFNYLGEDFGLAFYSPIGIDTKSEPSARVIADLIELIRKESIQALFIENITNPHLLEQIAQEAGVVVGGKLYSDALSEPNGSAPSYLEMVRHNVVLIVTALKKSAAQ